MAPDTDENISRCPICRAGQPLDIVVELDTTWVTAQSVAPLPGYACVVAKRHVEEPFQLGDGEMAAFWRESMLVARALDSLYHPTKMNYEIHGNTIPHLHLHLFPRFLGDPFEGGAITMDGAGFQRTVADLKGISQAIVSALGG
jgi:diadenosine tetraphosphate (Ap4A) HIT family hydrolase